MAYLWDLKGSENLVCINLASHNDPSASFAEKETEAQRGGALDKFCPMTDAPTFSCLSVCLLLYT